MMTTLDKVLLLKDIDLFAGLEGEHLAEVASVAEEARVAGGEPILSEGGRGDALYFVVEGRVRVVKGARTIAELGERGVIGELALLDPAPRTAGVIAATDSTLLRVERDDFVETLASRPEVSLGVIRVLVRRLCGAIE